MNFQEAESYLLSLGNEVETMKLGLDNIRKLLGALGNPEKSYLKVQVAGTNGKGSVCAFLDSICLQASIRTGVFTSPHLISITERVRINGSDISEEEFARFATIVRQASEKLVADGVLENVPTYFEQVTAIALFAFAEANVGLAILETGLGGRYDATTAANAEICAITRIDLDHQEYLGETITEIAAEKAAIIRSDTKAVVIGNQRKDAMNVLLDRCRGQDLVPQAAGKQYIWQLDRSGKTMVAEFDVAPPTDLGVKLGLAGRHQTENAYTSVMIAGTLANDFNLDISEDQIGLGLETAQHPGRLEYIGNFLLDGAHNVGGANALRVYLNEFVDRPITLIYGAMKDKDVREIADILFPKADKVILTQPSNSRALPVEQLAKFVPANIANNPVLQSNSIPDAIEKAEALVPENGIILVTGSLYLVGEVRKILTQHSEQV